MEDFEELACPVPPPITQVSRQLREETLLLFYKTCRLKVQLESQHAFSGENVATTVVPETKAFFSRAQKKYLQSVKRTCIRTNSYIIYPYVEAQWNVGLGANGNTTSVQLPQNHALALRDRDGPYRKARKDMEKRLETKFQSKSIDGSVRVLEREDAEMLGRLFNAEAEEQ